MIKSNLSSKDHSASKWKHALVTAALLGGLAVSAIAQEVLFQESFETDGDGSRYTVTGGDVYEVQRLTDEGIRGDQAGPVYWARSPDVSFVGVPGATVAKRLMMAWDGGIVDTDVTDPNPRLSGGEKRIPKEGAKRGYLEKCVPPFSSVKLYKIVISASCVKDFTLTYPIGPFFPPLV